MHPHRPERKAGRDRKETKQVIVLLEAKLKLRIIINHPNEKKILYAAHCGKHIHGYYPPVKERGEDENTEEAERQDVEDVGQEHLPFTVETILTLLIADGSQGRDWKHERESR